MEGSHRRNLWVVFHTEAHFMLKSVQIQRSTELRRPFAFVVVQTRHREK